eukprot:gnl/Chilomastix_cuspidata/4331.p2 GENE.gnl/Chilomastix_cuspidata/4331~~gnl/Chilomastix_cuspidata/4331.p2  ORF type:complete len:136 (-),score=9.03 gnl/Chilomastix_cuspidata/4331:261-668(-)
MLSTWRGSRRSRFPRARCGCAGGGKGIGSCYPALAGTEDMPGAFKKFAPREADAVPFAVLGVGACPRAAAEAIWCQAQGQLGARPADLTPAGQAGKEFLGHAHTTKKPEGLQNLRKACLASGLLGAPLDRERGGG